MRAATKMVSKSGQQKARASRVEKVIRCTYCGEILDPNIGKGVYWSPGGLPFCLNNQRCYWDWTEWG